MTGKNVLLVGHAIFHFRAYIGDVIFRDETAIDSRLRHAHHVVGETPDVSERSVIQKWRKGLIEHCLKLTQFHDAGLSK